MLIYAICCNFIEFMKEIKNISKRKNFIVNISNRKYNEFDFHATIEEVWSRGRYKLSQF